MEKKLQKIYPTFSNSLIAQDLWQAHYQNIVNNLSNEIKKNNCKYKRNDKKYEYCGITFEICDCFLESEILKMI